MLCIALALILDIAALTHGLILVWLVLSINRRDALYWDPYWAGGEMHASLDDIQNGEAPVLLFLAVTFALAAVAAALVWLPLLTSCWQMPPRAFCSGSDSGQ